MSSTAGLRPGRVPALVRAPVESVDARLVHVRRARWLLAGGDLGALVAVSYLGVKVWGWILRREIPRGTLRPIAWLPFVPVAMLLMAAYGLYRRPGRRVRSLTFLDLAHLFHALTVGGLLTLAVSGVLHRVAGIPKLTWSEVAACALPALVAIPLVRAGLTAFMDRRSIPRTRVIIVGSGVTAARLADRLARFGDIDLVGWAGDRAKAPGPACKIGPHLGGADEMARLCTRHSADRVLVALDDEGVRPTPDWFHDVPPGVRVSVVPGFSDLLTCRSGIDELHGLSVIDIAPRPAGVGQRAAKRALDVVVSAVMLAAFSPLIAVIAVIIKRGSEGPVLFRQVRAGRANRDFVMYKFRTMTTEAEASVVALRPFSDMDGPVFKLRNDPRVTGAGRFLRRYSLDEIPQLVNVLRGEMSLVGPRPLPIGESAAFRGWAARRLDVRPGMTGYWQVSGRNDLTFAELQELDCAYAASWSFWWDLKILWQTPGAVLARRGAY